MRKLVAAWLMFGGVSLLAAGCKSDPAEAPRVPVERFATEFSVAVCDNAARCCSGANFTFDQPNCEGRLKASFQASLDQVLMDPVDYDEVAAGKCLAALADRGCGMASFEFPACEGLFQGRLEDGAECERDAACKSRWCALRGDASVAVCEPLQSSELVVAGKQGDDCVDTCNELGDCPPIGGTPPLTVCYRTDGLFCGSRADGAVPHCEPLREVGQPCEQSRECAAGSFCQGICEAPHPNGASCEFDAECRSGACVDGECAESALTEEACVSGGKTF